MKKIFFKIKVDNVVDLITNSSSELFVLQGNTKAIVEEMIKDIYPDYLEEYDELKSIRECSNSDIDMFLHYKCSLSFYPCKKSDYVVLDGFTFDEMYDAEKPSYGNYISYSLKNNGTKKYDDFFVTDENRERILNSLDPNNNTYFLYSLDENPNWDFQEKLQNIGERFHLG